MGVPSSGSLFLGAVIAMCVNIFFFLLDGILARSYGVWERNIRIIKTMHLGGAPTFHRDVTMLSAWLVHAQRYNVHIISYTAFKRTAETLTIIIIFIDPKICCKYINFISIFIYKDTYTHIISCPRTSVSLYNKPNIYTNVCTYSNYCCTRNPQSCNLYKLGSVAHIETIKSLS